MKKIVLLILLISTSLTAQNKFELTPEGFKANGDTMIVIDIPDNNANELFKKAKFQLMALYKSYKNVASEVENEIITISAKELNVVRRNDSHVFNMDYKLVIRFKDDKIRFDAPTFNLSTRGQKLHLIWTGSSFWVATDFGIYGKNNKLISPLAKEDLEFYFNALISNITEAIKSDNEDDW